MEAHASVKNVRIAPRKLRTVVDMVRGKDLGAAQGILASNNKLNISRVLAKLLNQAMANARENMNLDIDRLYVKTITVDGGPSLKRFLPRMRGRADRILKRTSSVLVVLDERAQKAKKAKARSGAVKAKAGAAGAKKKKSGSTAKKATTSKKAASKGKGA